MTALQDRSGIYMAESEYNNIRKINITKWLNHEDIQLLAERLLEKFPESSRLSAGNYAGYLSQIFNPNGSRLFKEDLARRIELVWYGLKQGDIDRVMPLATEQSLYRCSVIKKVLTQGDYFLLVGRINNHYPNIDPMTVERLTKILDDETPYLLGGAFARKIESVWPTLEEGQLDGMNMQ